MLHICEVTPFHMVEYSKSYGRSCCFKSLQKASWCTKAVSNRVFLLHNISFQFSFWFYRHFNQTRFILYSRTSVARTPMARLPWQFPTHSWVPNKKVPYLQPLLYLGYSGWFSFYIENGMLYVLIRIAPAKHKVNSILWSDLSLLKPVP